MALFTEIEKESKMCRKPQRSGQSATANSTKNNRTGNITFPYFQLYYKAIVIKTVWYGHKNRHIDQETIESSEVNSCIHGQITFDKGAKNI